jgi:hypothetical protein
MFDVMFFCFFQSNTCKLLCFITAHHSVLTRPVKYFDLFNSSLMVLLGQLVFECDISPLYLEPIAKKLKLNLVHNIVRNCCPKIPNSLSRNMLNFGNGCEMNWGKIALNSSGVSIYK